MRPEPLVPAYKLRRVNRELLARMQARGTRVSRQLLAVIKRQGGLA